MNLALVGDDEAAVEFVRAAMDAGHPLLAVVALPGSKPSEKFPGVSVLRDLDQLAAISRLDALVLAGDVKGRADRLRHVQRLEAMDLVVAVPLSEKIDPYYELSIHQKTANVKILPLLSETGHPAVARIRRLLAESHGQVKWFDGQRRLDPAANGPFRFLEGWTWIRELVGEIESVTATGSGEDPLLSEHVAVAVRCENGILGNLRWEVGGEHVHRLTLHTERGRIEVLADRGFDGPILLTIQNVETAAEIIAAEASSIRWLDQWRRLTAANAAAALTPAIRQIEIAAGIVRSLKYQRTVTLDREEVFEESVFKSIMASTGCGLIWVIILLGILVAAKVPFVGYLFLPILLIFLALQLFGLVYRKSAEE